MTTKYPLTIFKLPFLFVILTVLIIFGYQFAYVFPAAEGSYYSQDEMLTNVVNSQVFSSALDFFVVTILFYQFNINQANKRTVLSVVFLSIIYFVLHLVVSAGIYKLIGLYIDYRGNSNSNINDYYYKIIIVSRLVNMALFYIIFYCAIKAIACFVIKSNQKFILTHKNSQIIYAVLFSCLLMFSLKLIQDYVIILTPGFYMLAEYIHSDILWFLIGTVISFLIICSAVYRSFPTQNEKLQVGRLVGSACLALVIFIAVTLALGYLTFKSIISIGISLNSMDSIAATLITLTIIVIAVSLFLSHQANRKIFKQTAHSVSTVQ